MAGFILALIFLTFPTKYGAGDANMKVAVATRFLISADVPLGGNARSSRTATLPRHLLSVIATTEGCRFDSTPGTSKFQCTPFSGEAR